MLTRAYTLRFLTPAFLGNATQTGQWRTPPIKALLRQWWRVAYAADQNGAINVAAMRSTEGKLFGTAADGEGESNKSQVRLRLSGWDKGRPVPWNGTDSGRVPHQEVKNRDGQVAPVGPLLYLGYGPLVFAQGQTSFKSGAPIQSDERATFSLAFASGTDAARLDKALWLMHCYGTLGGRARNGWGSFSLTPTDASTPAMAHALDARFTTPWQDALKLDWPHAIGCDARGPLIWQTEGHADWKAVMRRLALIKIGLRTQFTFPNVRPPHPQPLDRHWLSYPITNHVTCAWDRNARLPNSLRFKVRVGTDGKLRGVVFHVPCKPPREFRPDIKAITAVWQTVHGFLDQPAQGLTRIAT